MKEQSRIVIPGAPTDRQDELAFRLSRFQFEAQATGPVSIDLEFYIPIPPDWPPQRYLFLG